MINVENLLFSYSKHDTFSLSIDKFEVKENEHHFIYGPSGCGKTTFLNLLSGILTPQQGHVRLLNTDIAALSSIRRDQFRADHIGIIFQLFNLIEYLDVIDNVLLSRQFSKRSHKNVKHNIANFKEEAQRLCEALGISKELQKKPVKNLSIGQQQRVAIARTLIAKPSIIIADEPTSALDDESKTQFMNLLLEQCDKCNSTLLFVSHDKSLESYFDHSYNLSGSSR